MPKLTKAQQRLVDIIEEGGAEVILSRYSRNPYIYIYYKNKKPSVRRVSDSAFNSLFDYGVFEFSDTPEDQPVVLNLFRYKLEEYIEKSENEV